MLNNSVFLSKAFSYPFNRHCERLHNASYDVCHHWLCRIAFFVEKWLWYGGKVG